MRLLTPYSRYRKCLNSHLFALCMVFVMYKYNIFISGKHSSVEDMTARLRKTERGSWSGTAWKGSTPMIHLSGQDLGRSITKLATLA